LVIGDWGLGIGPNPQSPNPNPQSPIPNFFKLIKRIYKSQKKKYYIKINFNLKIKYGK